MMNNDTTSAERATDPPPARDDELMAECMVQFREDMIAAGVIDKSVPPMFMTEAILGAIQKARGAQVAAPVAPAEPAAWGCVGTLNGRLYLRYSYDRTPYPPPPGVVRNLNLVPLYAGAPPVQELSDEQIAAAVRPLYGDDRAAEMGLSMDIETARAVLKAAAPASPLKDAKS